MILIYIRYGSALFIEIHSIFYEFFSGIILGLIIFYFLKVGKVKKVYPFITDIVFLLDFLKLKKLKK